MKVNQITESFGSPSKYPDSEKGAIQCFTDISIYKPEDVTKVYPDPYTPYVWAIHTNTKDYGPQKHVVWLEDGDFATDDRSGDDDFKVMESTTAGSIATVSMPLSTQKRSSIGKGVYGNEKPGNLLTGKKTSKKYANSLSESTLNEITQRTAIKHEIKNLRNLLGGEYEAPYDKGRGHWSAPTIYIPHLSKEEVVKALQSLGYKKMDIKRHFGDTYDTYQRKDEHGHTHIVDHVHDEDYHMGPIVRYIRGPKSANSVTESKADRDRNRLMKIATDYEDRAKKTKDPIKKDHYRKMADDARSKIVEKGHVSESKMKQVAMDIMNLDHGNFQKKYKMSKEQMKQRLGNPESIMNEDSKPSLPDEAIRVARILQNNNFRHVTFRRYLNGNYELHAYIGDSSLSGSIYVYFKNDQVYKVTVNGGGNISGPANNQVLTFDDDDIKRFDNLEDAIRFVRGDKAITEATLEEDDKIIAPGKGKQRKSGLHKPGEEKKLSHFKHPFKSSGIHISDGRGNAVAECENEDVAKEVCKALNDYVKMDESVLGERVERVGAFSTKDGAILKLLKSEQDPQQFYLINPKGEVVKQLRGSEIEVKAEVQRDLQSLQENKRKR